MCTIIGTLQDIIIITVTIMYFGSVFVQYHTRFLYIKYGIWILGRLPTLRAVVLSDIFRSLQENFEIVLRSRSVWTSSKPLSIHHFPFNLFLSFCLSSVVRECLLLAHFEFVVLCGLHTFLISRTAYALVAKSSSVTVVNLRN